MIKKQFPLHSMVTAKWNNSHVFFSRSSFNEMQWSLLQKTMSSLLISIVLYFWHNFVCDISDTTTEIWPFLYSKARYPAISTVFLYQVSPHLLKVKLNRSILFLIAKIKCKQKVSSFFQRQNRTFEELFLYKFKGKRLLFHCFIHSWLSKSILYLSLNTNNIGIKIIKLLRFEICI